MIFYHGTTWENIRAIVSQGLLKGQSITPDYQTARYFAEKRASFNGFQPLVLQIETDNYTPIRSDTVGHLESELTENIYEVVTMPEMQGSDFLRKRTSFLGVSSLSLVK